MINFDDVMNRLIKCEDILRTTNILEDEKTKQVLFETVADMLETTAKMLKPAKEVEEDE